LTVPISIYSGRKVEGKREWGRFSSKIAATEAAMIIEMSRMI